MFIIFLYEQHHPRHILIFLNGPLPYVPHRAGSNIYVDCRNMLPRRPIAPNCCIFLVKHDIGRCSLVCRRIRRNIRVSVHTLRFAFFRCCRCGFPDLFRNGR